MIRRNSSRSGPAVSAFGLRCMGMLIREGLASRNRDKLLLSVKFGALRDPAQGWTGYDARPAAGAMTSCR